MQTDIESIDVHGYNDMALLDELVGDCSIPDRNWDGIIAVFNSNTEDKFLIPPIVCSHIVRKVKDGGIPRMIFREYGLSYQSFSNKVRKIRDIIEEISNSRNISDADIIFIDACKNNPNILLSRDIDRAVAFNFNRSLDHLKKISDINPQAWKEYMKTVNPEEFVEKDTTKNTEVIIKIAPGLMDGI